MSNTSTFRFQPPQGLGWSVVRRPKFQTQVQDSVSKIQQLRISDQQLWPMWEYEFVWNYLKGGAENSPGTQNAFQQLIGYYMARMNTFNNSNNESFLYEDPNHNLVGTINTPDNSHVFATGDGSTTKFQLQRRIGSGFDIVQNVNGDGSFYTSVPAVPIQLYKFGFEGIKNLIINSGQIGGNAWSVSYANFSNGPILQGPVVTLNAAFAPDGSCSASKIVFPVVPNSGDVSEIFNYIGTPEYGGILNGRTFTFSFWARTDSGNLKLQISMSDNQTQGSDDTITVTPQWQRFSTTFSFTAVTNTLVCVIRIDSTLSSGAVYLWGPQCEENSSPTVYQATSTVNRWGPVYQIPVSRHNYCLWSQAFDNAAWSLSNITRPTADTVTSPDGSTTAEALTVITNGTDSFASQSISTPSRLNGFFVTFSVWLKVPSGTKTINIYVTWSTGTGSNSLKSVTLTDKWQRFTVQATLPSGLTFVAPQIGGGNTFTSGTIYAWGAQLENWGSNGVNNQGQANPYPWAGTSQDGGTSYLPTTSSEVTIQDYTLDSIGNVNLGSAPASNALLSWAGKYLMRLHFSDDSIDVEEFMFQLHTLRKLKMESVII